MGEYADMEVFAQQRGKTTSDLSLGELKEFYGGWDDERKPSTTRLKCPHCGSSVADAGSPTL